MSGYSYETLVEMMGRERADELFAKNNVEKKLDKKKNPHPEYTKLSEGAHAKLLHKHLTKIGVKHTHIAGESGQSGTGNIMAMMMKKKSMGTSKGFPDYVAYYDNGDYTITFYIELKKARGVMGGMNGSVVSQEQVDWLNHLKGCPFTYVDICHGSDEAISFIEGIINSHKVSGDIQVGLYHWQNYPKKEFTI